MSILEIILIATGLAMDCFAVSIASSMALGHYDWPKMLRMAFMFGLFQGVMPLVGFLAGISFATTITKIDHWIALVILLYIGGKMIYESFKKKDGGISKNPLGSIKTLVILSVATSIDALATGLMFVPQPHLMALGSVIIGVVSFLFTLLGCFIGVHFGKRFKLNVELIGGIILIIIGLKIFLEHTMFQ